MKPANMDRLKDKVIRPDFDKHLIPLLLYRGAVSLGRIQRGWNFALTMMESEVESFPEAAYMSMNPDFAHLIGPQTRITMNAVRSLFGRLRGNPAVTDNIPRFTSYCRDVVGMSYDLTPISLYTMDHKCKTPWRIYQKPPRKPKNRTSLDRAGTLFYPYLIHKPKEGDAEMAMMLAVNAAVPSYLPDFLRADICQDILMAILGGEMTMDDLKDQKRQFIKRVTRAHPMKYGDLSLDAALSSDDERDRHGISLPAGVIHQLEW